MAGIKFFVYGSGTWREVDTDSGRVSGWGLTQFVYMRHGRLIVARRKSVLKGLRALAAGRPTTVRDGDHLSQIRNKKKVNRNQQNIVNQQAHCCSCQHGCFSHRQQHSDLLFDSLLKTSTNTVATQYILQTDNATQVQSFDEQQNKDTEIEKNKHKCPVRKWNKEPRKELIIDEDDVLLVRSFIERDQNNIFNMPLHNFDANDRCKRNVFYKINPLVVVSRSHQIAEMYRAQSQSSSVTLKDFISNLGLQSVHDIAKKNKYKMRARISKRSEKSLNESDTDKENISIIKSIQSSQQTNKINQSLKNHAYLELKRNSKGQFLKGKRNNKFTHKGKNENKPQNDNSVKNSHKRVVSLYKSQQKEKNPTNSVRKVGSFKNKSPSNDRSNKLVSVKDYGSESDKKVNNNTQKITISSSKRGNLPEEKLLKQSLKSCRDNNNKTFNSSKNKSEENNRKGKVREEDTVREIIDEDIFKEKTNNPNQKVINTKLDTNIHKQTSKETGMDKDEPKIVTRQAGNTEKNTLVTNGSKRNILRTYSRLEDEAIVSWLGEGGRARLVKGNRVWQELQPLHHKTTGHFRPWQSLRNRYLRYLLPTLGDLGVPPAVAQRLRAAAAEGELKSKTAPSSCASILKEPRVRSAWALRPRSPAPVPVSSPSLAAVPPTTAPSPPVSPPAGVSLRRRTIKSTEPPNSAERISNSSSDFVSSYTSGDMPKRVLRSSAAHSPTLPTPRRKLSRRSSLTYSELTRRFASRHKSTPESATQINSSKSSVRPKRSRSATSQSDTASSDNQRGANRKRSRSQVSGSTSSFEAGRRRVIHKSRVAARPRTRRLYNPRAL